MNPPDWNAVIEIHPADWIFPADSAWVAGRVTSAGGLVPRDVRARFGDRMFLGLCGLPRPERDLPTADRPPPPGAGFSFLLPPVAGAAELRIEVCDQHGRWTEVLRQEVSSAVIAATVPPVRVTPPPDANFLLDLLRAKHARPAESWRTLADELACARRAESFDVMPSEPFKGALEQMADRVAAHYDHILVTGWVAHRREPIVRLTACLDTAAPRQLLHGLDRPDAGAMFPEFHDAGHGRFAGFLRLPPTLPRPLALRIFAELPDGSRTLVFLKRLMPVVVSGAGIDLPPFSPWRFLRAAIAGNRVTGPWRWTDPAWRQVMADAWQAYRALAPSRRLPRAAAAVAPAPDRPLVVTLVTHNLNFEGAPLFLLELARYLAGLPGWHVRLVSAAEGPLRERFDKAGIPVALADAAPAWAADDDAAFASALGAMADDEAWHGADLIIANTLVAAWAVPLAQRLGIRSLLYIHESAGIRRFFALDHSAAALARIERAVAGADRVVFPAADGQRAHAYLAGRKHFRALPGWVDVAAIDRYLAAHDRARLRAEAGLAPDAVVFAHIGSFLPRKGLHVLVDAIRTLVETSGAGGPMVFLLVGAKSGPDPYADLVRHAAATIPGADIRFLPQSPEPLRFFLAVDVFVCASLEEVFPRVLLEAAVCACPIVTTNVNGIPEMLGPRDAWLVPPDDPKRLASAMRAALAAHERGDRTRARRAEARVRNEFDAAVMLPRHVEEIRRAVGTPST